MCARVCVCVQPPKTHKYTHQVYAALAQHKSAPPAEAPTGQLDYEQEMCVCVAEMFGLTPQ